VSWFDSLKIVKKVNLPIIYIIALAVVLALLAWWFSLKPVVKARDFLPESTSFYYHWTDRKYWVSENNQLSTLFNLQEPQTKLENLQAVLPQAASLLKTRGKLIVISYHSLEDRIVKQYFKQESRDCLCPPALPICQCGHKANLKILTHHIIRPTGEEVLRNPRSRSAKLRAAERM